MADTRDMPPGWKEGPSRIATSKFHDKVVDDYLELVRWSQQEPEKIFDTGSAFGPLAWAKRAAGNKKYTSRLHRMIRERVRDARIFEIVPDLFIRIDREVDYYTTEELAGLKLNPDIVDDTPWGQVVRRPDIPPDEMVKYMRAVRFHSSKLGVPNPRPFDTMWLGMGNMITLTSRIGIMNERMYQMQPGVRVEKAPSIAGILISDDFICELDFVTFGVPGRGDFQTVMVIPVWLDDMWISPELGHPWTLNALIEIINQQDTLITETPVIDKRKFSERRWWQATVKKKKIKGAVLPPMYYTVTIKPSTRDEKVKLAMQGARNWTHQWDVRGHPFTKVDGGYKPIDPKKKRRLITRGYTIIENPDDLTEQQASILLRHKKPFPTQDIWVAVRISWRKAFVKGPKSKPYIPAAWKLQEQQREKK